MPKTGWIFIIFVVIAYIGGYSSGSESGRESGYDEGYKIAESDLSYRLEELEEAEVNLQNAQDCISEMSDQLSETYSRVDDISSNLEFNLTGDYYDLYDAVDSAYSDLNSIDFSTSCN